jgi:hypothetical protein
VARAPVRETAAMIAGMAPRLVPGEVAFACLAPAQAQGAMADARALVREDEGVTLVLPRDHPDCPPGALALRQITLGVPSALDGVGLTAAVSTALAREGIACNVLAGAHHDHLFVPAGQAEAALAALRALARSAG